VRSKVLSAGLLAAFLPGTCNLTEGLLAPLQQRSSFDIVAPFDVGFGIGNRQASFKDEPEEPKEPVDVPDGSNGST
jgi:hypothetical protein